MLLDEIKKLVEQPIKDLGYSYVEISFLRENKNDILRIIVDKDDAISLDDIVKVNEVVSPLLDEADLIEGNYMLDITSLGAEKPIKIESLEKYVNKYVNIHLTHPYKGENYLEGTLLSVNETEVHIELRDKARKINACINRSDIDKARLAIKF